MRSLFFQKRSSGVSTLPSFFGGCSGETQELKELPDPERYRRTNYALLFLLHFITKDLFFP
jgi:hypothetical protein